MTPKVLPEKSDGKMEDLPDNGGTTMRFDRGYKCPVGSHHVIVGSSRRIYCPICGVYWRRENVE